MMFNSAEIVCGIGGASICLGLLQLYPSIDGIVLLLFGILAIICSTQLHEIIET